MFSEFPSQEFEPKIVTRGLTVALTSDARVTPARDSLIG
jgi:hypothetical protein